MNSDMNLNNSASRCHYWKCFLSLNLFMGLILSACAPVNDLVDKTTSRNLDIAPLTTPKPTSALIDPPMLTNTPSTNLVTITGWFTTVWNDEPHYTITDNQGQTAQLLLDDEIAKPIGGPLELDRKRVTIVGEIISTSPKIIRVLSVQFAGVD